MKTSDIKSIIENQYPTWDQDTRDFYIEFLSQMPCSEHIQAIRLGLGMDFSKESHEEINLTIIKFHEPLLHSDKTNIQKYLNTFTGEDLIHYHFSNELLIIEMAY